MFCRFSTDMKDSKKVILDINFITDILPDLLADCLKVYIYGLSKCYNQDEYNTITDFAEELNMSEQDIEEAFWYLDSKGLVRVIDQKPMEVIFISTENAKSEKYNYSSGKYHNFTFAVQSYFEGSRQILPKEFEKYIETMEVMKIEQNAMLRIIKYCIDYKGKSVGYPYIISVAKNWAYSGIHNLEAVEEKITELGTTEENILDILKTLGLRRSATLDERQLYIKWTNTFGFLYETIIYVAQSQKKKGGTSKLDFLLTRYFELRLFSENEIKAYEEDRQNTYNLAKTICKTLGKYYEVFDNIVDTYIIPWKNKGYDDKTLTLIADMCFKTSLRSLEDMDLYIQKLFKLGIISEQSIYEYMRELKEKDDKIYAIFEKLGLTKRVRQQDRALYDVWSKDWKMEEDIILYSASKSIDKQNPTGYMNRLLSDYHDRGLFNMKLLESNEKLLKASEENTKNPESKLGIYSYTDEQVLGMFQNLDEVEL